MVKVLYSPEPFWDVQEELVQTIWPIICIDLNGVLDQYDGWRGGVYFTPPAPGAELFLQRAREHFNTVVILTATRPLEKVIEWLCRYKLDCYVDYVTYCKIPANVYVDDLAVRHNGNFKRTWLDVISLRPHWEKQSW